MYFYQKTKIIILLYCISNIYHFSTIKTLILWENWYLNWLFKRIISIFFNHPIIRADCRLTWKTGETHSLTWQTKRKRAQVLKMFPILVLVCFPFSLPSFYLAFRLHKVRYLDSIFNQHVALMMIFSGKSSIVKTDFCYNKISQDWSFHLTSLLQF